MIRTCMGRSPTSRGGRAPLILLAAMLGTFLAATLAAVGARADAPRACIGKPPVMQLAQSAAPKTPARRVGGKVFRDCDGCPEMVVIPGGSFTTAVPYCEPDQKSIKGLRRRVTIRRFAIGRFEVTFEEWELCRLHHGCSHRPNDAGWGRGRRPVTDVSWLDAKQFVAWLSLRSGKRYRLPSGTEWEYAARAGTKTGYWWGKSVGKGNAVCFDCGSRWDRKSTAPVGSFRPNPFGLYDVHGNAAEWVEDCMPEDYRQAPTDGRAWTRGADCDKRQERGGGWRTPSEYLKAACKGDLFADWRAKNEVGFRVVRSLP